MAEQKKKTVKGAGTRTTARKTTVRKTEATEAPKAPEATAQSAEVEALKEQLAETKRMLEMMQAQLAVTRPQVVQVMADTEKVALRWQAEVAEENVLALGPNGMYGTITGKTGYASVPKSEWSKFLDESMKGFIRKRMLIVLSGLDEDERETYGCAYREGELLDEKAFQKLLDMGEEMIAVFPKLCHEHKEMVARRFVSGYAENHPSAHNRKLVVALNELSKQDPMFPKKGAFYSIIEMMNEKDLGE
jgi:hypothetical protein